MMRALVCGVSAQDGAYLSRFLLSKGYEVFGSSRDAQASSFVNLQRLGIRDAIRVISIAVNDFRSVLQALIRIQPDEVYNLAGQSSVGLSFDQPVETVESITVGTLNLLEAIRFTGRPIRFYNAGSGEMFGDTRGSAADETTPLRPCSPYAVAKASAYWTVSNYRDAYRLFACTGILFNHESPLRPPRFVTQKIVTSARRIAAGSRERLHLGNISIVRDWGWAPEYVEAMWTMLQQEIADDFIIATGESRKLEEFVKLSFSLMGLDWQEHTVIDPEMLRPADLAYGGANPEKAWKTLGWRAQSKMDAVVRMMIEGYTGTDSM